MNNVLEQTFINVFTGVLVSLITLAGGYLVLYIRKATQRLKAETSKIEDENTRKLINDSIDRLTDIVNTNVVKAQETTIKELQLASADGVIDRDELKKVGLAVKEDVLSQMSDQLLDAVQLQIKDVGAYVEGLIEQQLLVVKNQSSVNVVNTTESESKEEVVESSSEPITISEENEEELPER